MPESRRGRPLPPSITSRLRLPVISAPMLRVSGPDLVAAACRSGVVGAFPTANARTVEELDAWLTDIGGRLAEAERPAAPVCPNLIIRQPRLPEDLACLVRHRVEMVITSVGSPAAVVGPLHDIGCLVFADIASLRHAEKAIEAGADGLILLTAGAGGQTGWANPFAFVRAVRAIFDGPIVLAGGVGDGRALRAAEVLGCDLAYMGTRFIATTESMAAPAYKAMLVASGMDDVLLTRAFTGLDASMLRPSIVAAGLDPSKLDEEVAADRAKELYGGGAGQAFGRPKRWTDIWSAGHSVSAVDEVMDTADLIDRLCVEYAAAAP
ncbi:nitronate monooxygenase [Constrictibacter sp. MBR-5]|uniref:NAD(P)H-dependent flavin oxidoreductase n=1 Tax=Constrictibacter sp. MBR-5 TaxID=3156467 RepID=UPI0033937737